MPAIARRPRPWQVVAMTLTARIVALMLAAQLALAGAAAAVLVANAQRAVAAEVAASVHAARNLVVATLATLAGTVPGEGLTAALAERLVEPRHARIAVYDGASGRTLGPGTAAPRPDPAPAWFARLVAPQGQATELPVVENRRVRGVVVIAGDPAAGTAEAWHDARALAALIGLGAAAQLVLTAAILRGGLRPLARLSDVVRRLSRGELATRAGPVSTPDLAPLAADLDRLGAALAAAHADRARLSRQVVGRGDQERKAIARDLHDEYGPCLFALRVEAQAIRDRSPDPAAREHAGNILAIADEIRRVNTALLSGLRPMAVGQLPLATVLSDMIDDLSRRHPAIRWTLTLPPDLPEPDEATALTLYRILQEGTTNALRHSDATAVTASVSHDAGGWSVTLSDDGRGLGGAPEGNGLSGMRERVALLGGSFGMRDSARGVTLHATLPPES